MTARRKICVPLTTRGNYAKMKTTLTALRDSDAVTLQVVVGGALLDAGYGPFLETIENDGFPIDHKLDYPAKGGSMYETASAAGLCTSKAAKIFEELQPDVVMIIADRYESLSIAQAAMCMNICIAHLEGGEVSGSIDERIRHAITKLSHIHFPATKQAGERIERLGEAEEHIHVVGTPSLDQIQQMDLGSIDTLQAHLNSRAGAMSINLSQDYLVVSQHSVVTECDEARSQFEQTADAVFRLNLPTVWVLPNDDVGGVESRDVVEALGNKSDAPPLCVVGGLGLGHYARLLFNAKCLIGNTSSGLREGAFLGVPVVNIGTRQHSRERGHNVMDSGYDSEAIVAAATQQIAHGRYRSDSVYGSGDSGGRIAAVLEKPIPPLDKTILY
ncbi:UDP-N-acetylglucosamine 2-epimerase [Magnetovibrio sp. PR-2]|uniref:UDP-N-acetylglucosamine 2-epimerase n=1 Tax=Magnetovibrio sp. PR-2 TaxID=3120356 RepID=UPI002FCE22A6